MSVQTSDDNLSTVLETMLMNFNKNGVELKYVDFNKNIPEFYVKINGTLITKSKTSIDEMLKSIYGILWTLCYGKVNDYNKNYKIELKYEVV